MIIIFLFYKLILSVGWRRTDNAFGQTTDNLGFKRSSEIYRCSASI